MQASPDDIRELKEIFMSIDKNGDGNLTFEELKTGLEQKQNAKELMEVMMAADTDNSGTINYTEFIAATMDAKLYAREEMIRTAFEMFDTDNSGKIDKEELENLLNGEDIRNEFNARELEVMI